MKSKRGKYPERGQIDIYAKRSFNGHRRGFYHVVYRDFSNFDVKLGSLQGDAKYRPYSPGCCFIELTNEGMIIDNCIKEWSSKDRAIRICAYAVMPDHIHVLLHVKEWLPNDLVNYTVGLKLLFERHLRTLSAPTASHNANSQSLQVVVKYFGGRYDPTPLSDYILSNPHRLGMGIQYPRFFNTIRTLTLSGVDYQAIGNFFLLRNPDKLSVRIDDEWSEWKKKQANIIYRKHLNSGGILVSPFLSRVEQSMFKEAEEAGAKSILITSCPLKKILTPTGVYRSLFERRLLLIVTVCSQAQKSSTEPSISFSSEENVMDLYSLADTISAMP